MSIGRFDRMADVHVFSKHWDYGELELAGSVPCPVFDICDDHFASRHGDYYRAMAARCHCVVSSVRLGERVLEETGVFPEYIPEPWELAEGHPKEPSPDPLILWFGHSSNLGTIVPYLGTHRILLCTNARHDPKNGVVMYTQENLQQCLEICDFVIIPQVKDWKSANRMVESLRAGRFVVASDIPSYRGFDQYLGDIEEGIEWVKSGPIISRIISGRNALTSFSPEKVGESWLNFISAAVRKSSVAT